MFFYFSSRYLCFKQPIKKIRIKFKNPMSPEPFVSRAKAPPVKRSEKGYGDENGLRTRGISGRLELTTIDVSEERIADQKYKVSFLVQC